MRHSPLQESCRLLADHNAGRHRVAGRYAGHDGSIRNTEAVHTVDLQLAIDHRHRIAAHFCGATLMPEGAEPVAEKPLQLRCVEGARRYLASRERSQSRGITDLASNPY